MGIRRTAVRAALLCLLASLFAPGGAFAQAKRSGDKAADKNDGKRKSKSSAGKSEADKNADKSADKGAADKNAGKSAGKNGAGQAAASGAPAASAAPPPPPPSRDPTGMEENPEAPDTDFERPVGAQVDAAASAPPVPTGYPIERALRPITLPQRMTEITIDAPNSFNPYVQSGLLGIRHGVTREIQAGLRYGTGTLYDGEYFAGKAFSIDGEVQVFPWLAAQVSVPMLVDPYAVGVTVGAPIKAVVLGRLRFDLLRDFATFKLSRFAPSVVDAAENDRLVVADETNSVIEDGQLNLNAAATWQLQSNLAIEGRFGLKGRDFEFESDSPTALDVGLLYSSVYSGANQVDIGGRVGFADLNQTDETFGLWLVAALRI